ncbi:ras-related protein Rab-17 isoform 2-T2 [Glossophaga mutica]
MLPAASVCAPEPGPHLHEGRGLLAEAGGPPGLPPGRRLPEGRGRGTVARGEGRWGGSADALTREVLPAPAPRASLRPAPVPGDHMTGGPCPGSPAGGSGPRWGRAGVGGWALPRAETAAAPGCGALPTRPPQLPGSRSRPLPRQREAGHGAGGRGPAAGRRAAPGVQAGASGERLCGQVQPGPPLREERLQEHAADRGLCHAIAMTGRGCGRFSDEEVDHRPSSASVEAVCAQQTPTEGGHVVDLGAASAKLEIWDTAGQEKYHSVCHLYFRGADAALLVYDITSKESFRKARQWLRDLETESSPGEVVVMLVGNKTDLGEGREVTLEEGKEFAESQRLLFMETSARDNHQVTEAFSAIARELLRRAEREQRRTPRGDARLALDQGPPGWARCCAR